MGRDAGQAEAQWLKQKQTADALCVRLQQLRGMLTGLHDEWLEACNDDNRDQKNGVIVRETEAITEVNQIVEKFLELMVDFGKHFPRC